MIKYAAMLIIFIITTYKCNNTHKFDFSFANGLSNVSSSSTKMLMSLKFTFQDLKKFSLKERMGGFPPVSIKTISNSNSCMGWERYTKEKNLNAKNFIINPRKQSDRFFFSVTDNIIFVYTNQNIKSTTAYDSIMISSLNPIIMGDYLTGGVVDLGNFKEGYCFELKGIRNKSQIQWIVCSDSYVFIYINNRIKNLIL
jgi:hypothetical protein